MFTKEKFNELNNLILPTIEKGWFLITRDGNRDNIMTIGWYSLGFFWEKPVFILPVRNTRYSYELLSKNKCFNICIPNDKSIKNIGKCGSLSGRDCDKFSKCGFIKEKAHTNNVPIITDSKSVIECKTIFQTSFNNESLDELISKNVYPNKDFHELYFGEITDYYDL